MKYKVKKIKQAEHEYNSLTIEQQKLLKDDYNLIENEGLERVSTKKIEKDIYEIRTANLRSLYTYSEGTLIIVVTIFIKTTNKTPEWAKETARIRIKNL
ncbi:MAG: type II toxin-antitoxin system RelE/ParE family toxin [Candidatus Gastranaerophilales bacterium]|nr:type II toxin-antitoxin system RelE/ParE family toxin [Candidatus Gastranaerophilales bacterium]